MADELAPWRQGRGAPRRQPRLIKRALPAVGSLALFALAGGLALGGLTSGEGAKRVARDFGLAWAREDYGGMYRLLSADARTRVDRRSFEAGYRKARSTATATGLRVGPPENERDGAVPLPVAVPTRVFGTVRERVLVPVRDDRVAWAPALRFPGLRDDEVLSRRTVAPERAPITSVDGRTVAQGPAQARGSPLGALAASVAGTVGRSDDAQVRRRLVDRGFPADTPVGMSGLERILDERVAGRPGGVLLAGGRVLARTAPRPAEPVKSTIDSRLQEAAVAALAGRLGGIAALDPRTGAVRALAGIAFSAPQPPGSTFKIVTATAALEAGLAKPSDTFPVETKAVIDGVDLENANGELCGGSLERSFAESCNSVFGPLGVKVGAERMVETAERYGWNGEPTLPGEMPSTLPASDMIDSPLEVGSTAIGQFQVLATPLQMASVAQTVANGGVRVLPSALEGAPPQAERVTSPGVAKVLSRLMLAVVDNGTGTAAAIQGVRVAGKTGTAELEDTRGPEGEARDGDPTNTDAWFTAYAPAARPSIAVAVLLVRNGAGGETAAPAARLVLQRALGR